MFDQPAVDHKQAVKFTVAPVTGNIGAEVEGIDLADDLSDVEIEALSAALMQHKVLFFRDQPMTQQQHIAFTKRFGTLEVHPFAKLSSFGNDAAHPEIIRIESTPERPAASEDWHSDVSFMPAPSMGSVLRSLIAPPVGGDTLWANMAAAYEGLDDSTRLLISGLTAIHDWWQFREFGMAEDEIARWKQVFPLQEHPVVRTHPVTGEKCLYVNRNFTIGIKGMKESESRPLLEKLYAQASIPTYQVRFRWRENSVAFWDNRCTQHCVASDFFPNHRRMERVTLAGDQPF